MLSLVFLHTAAINNHWLFIKKEKRKKIIDLYCANCRVDEKLYPNHCSNKKEGTNENGHAKLQEDNNWGRYARGAVYALQEKEHCLSQVRDFFLFWSL